MQLPRALRNIFLSKPCFVVVFMLIPALHSAAMSQLLKRRNPDDPQCAPVELRFVAKHSDGALETKLVPAQIEVRFADGVVDVVSMRSFAPEKDSQSTTDILFVIPPMADVGSPRDVQDIISTLSHHDEFKFRAAVLSPDGNRSDFTPDLATLKSDLTRAVLMNNLPSVSKWAASELQAFLALRRLDGRHVVVRFFDPANPHLFLLKAALVRDTTLEVAASYDIAVVYALQPPIDTGMSIPGGDGSSSHMDASPDTLGFEQSLQMQAASNTQATAWKERFAQNRSSAGRTEPSASALLNDVIKDAAGTYDLVVQPRYACPDHALRPVWIQPAAKDLLILGPSRIQMIPYTPPSGK